MKHAIRFQLHYLLNKKTRILISIYTLSVMGIMVILSRFYYSTEEKILSRHYLQLVYLIDVLTIVVVCLLILIVFVIMRLVLQAPSDLLLIQRMGCAKLVISKLVSVLIMITPIMIIWGLWFYIVGVLAHQSIYQLVTLQLFVDMGLLGLFYSVFMVLIALLFKHILPLLIPIIGVMFSTLIIDLSQTIEKLSYSDYILNTFFPTLHIINNQSISFILPHRTLLILIGFNLFIILLITKKENITT